MSNKGYRLDNVEWYDSKTDQVRCLECGEWWQNVAGHMQVHKMSVAEYKAKYDILPKTPLKNKRLLDMASKATKKMRAEGKFNVFKKGETTIPKSYRANPIHIRQGAQENNRLVGSGQRGKQKSAEHIAKMRENGKKQDHSHLKAHEFKKGQKPQNFIGGKCMVYGCDRPYCARGFCNMHWQRNKKLREAKP